jgi:peptidyl-prolyl cis-trans isomerase-like 4
VAEGVDTTLRKINSAYVDPKNNRPYQNIRIKHTLIIDDPFPDPTGLREPSRSPSPVQGKDDYLDDSIDIHGMMKDKTDQ